MEWSIYDLAVFEEVHFIEAWELFLVLNVQEKGRYLMLLK